MSGDAEDCSQLERLAQVVHTRRNLPNVQWAFGVEHLPEHGEGRRIIWVHANSPIENAQRAGGTEVAADNTRKVVLRDVLETVRIYIYAESDGALECLRNDVINAIDDCVPFGDSAFKGIEYPPKQGQTQRNVQAVINVSFRNPIVNESKKLRPLNGYLHTCGTLQDDGTVKPQDDGT
jgi:hypothetical protein